MKPWVWNLRDSGNDQHLLLSASSKQAEKTPTRTCCHIDQRFQEEPLEVVVAGETHVLHELLADRGAHPGRGSHFVTAVVIVLQRVSCSLVHVVQLLHKETKPLALLAKETCGLWPWTSRVTCLGSPLRVDLICSACHTDTPPLLRKLCTNCQQQSNVCLS